MKKILNGLLLISAIACHSNDSASEDCSSGISHEQMTLITISHGQILHEFQNRIELLEEHIPIRAVEHNECGPDSDQHSVLAVTSCWPAQSDRTLADMCHHPGCAADALDLDYRGRPHIHVEQP